VGDGLQFSSSIRDYNVAIGGDDGIVDGVFVPDGSRTYEDVVHHLWGNNQIIRNVRGTSGDDLIGVGTSYNIGCKNVTISDIIAEGVNFSVKLYAKREGIAAGYGAITEAVDGVTVRNVRGTCKAGIGWKTDAATPTMVRNVTVDGVNVDCSSGTSPAIYGEGGYNISVKVNAKGCNSNFAQLVASTGWDKISIEINTTDAPVASGSYPVNVDGTGGGGNLKLSGNVVCNDRSGLLQNNCFVDATNFIVKDVPTSRYIALVQGTSRLRMLRCGGTIASGATGTAGVRIDTSASVDLSIKESDFSAFANPLSRAGTLTSYGVDEGSGGFNVSRTIASGAVSWQGERVLSLLGEGDATDSIDTLNGVPPAGFKLRIINGHPDPTTKTITLTNGTAGSKLYMNGSSKTLDTLYKASEVIYQNGRWNEVVTTGV
jgi:hypothetical protein